MDRTRCIAVALSASLWACGGSDSGQTADESNVLFAGPPAELLPHDVGRTTTFVVRAQSGVDEITTTVTTAVLSEGPGGEFILETAPDGGSPRRIRAREYDDRIEADAFATLEDGYLWQDLDPPSLLVWTPLIAGEGRRTGFQRELELLIEVDGDSEVRTVTFSGEIERTPSGLESIAFRGETVEAITFDVKGSGIAASHAGLPGGSLRISIEGTEHRAPGIGQIREEMTLTIEHADTEAVVTTTSTRSSS